MKVKILLSIGYIVLFALLGYRTSFPQPPMLGIIFCYILFSACFVYTWLGDTVSKGQK